METNWTKLIERYLNNELSAEGKIAFEKELAINAELRAEVELQQLTQTIIARTATREMVNSAKKSYFLKKYFTGGVIALLVISVAIIAAMYLMKTTADTDTKDTQTEKEIFQTQTTFTDEEFAHLDTISMVTNQKEKVYIPFIEQLEQQKKFHNIPSNYFKFTGESDAFLTSEGTLLSVTKNSFTLNGNAYSGPAVIQFQEAITAAHMAKAGLSTRADDKLLETQGMFSLQAFTPDGQLLTLSDKGVYVQVPVDEYKQGMKLFDGVMLPNGDVNWVNPVELERLPQARKMADLDFYPGGYAAKLHELKWKKQKAQRDSLYLSFEFDNNSSYNVSETMVTSEPLDRKKARTSSNDNVNKLPIKISNKEKTIKSSNYPYNNIKLDCKLEYLGNNEAFVVVTAKLKPNWYLLKNMDINYPFKTIEIKLQSGIRTIGNLIDENSTLPYYDEPFFQAIADVAVFKQKISFEQSNKNLDIICNYSIGNKTEIYPYDQITFNLPISQKLNNESKFLPPSNVLAIWKPAFEGTNLATVEFEERMQAIHETCDKRLLELYVNNLNEPLWKLDERAVKMGYPQFQKFADQRVGKLVVSDEHQQNMQQFYEQTRTEIQQMGRSQFQDKLNKQREWDQKFQAAQTQDVIRKGIRESQNLKEEFEFNMDDVYKQLGKKRPKVGFTMSRGSAVKNIDRYVMDATIARQSTTITDPDTKKTAQIVYNEFSIEVHNAKQYDKLYIYLFSQEMTSFQRLDMMNRKLKYNLNAKMNYKAAVIGINKDQTAIYEIQNIKTQNGKSIELKAVTDKEFTSIIQRLNNERRADVVKIDDELNWLFTLQKNYVELDHRKKDAEFRNQLRPIVFKCWVELKVNDNTLN